MDLKPKIDYQGLRFRNDARVLDDESKLPRARLSSNLNILEKLLNLVENALSDESEPIWQLM